MIQLARAVIVAAIVLAAAPLHAQPQNYYSKLTHTSGSAIVNGVPVAVAGAGAVGTLTPCGPTASPYYLNSSGSSYTFTFAVPVGAVKLGLAFGSGGVAGSVHVTVNGAAYPLTSANFAGTVPETVCSSSVPVVLDGGDIKNTGQESANPSGVLYIPGPVSSITVASTGTANLVFGLQLAPQTYFRVSHASGAAAINGVSTTVTGSGNVDNQSLCGSLQGPYLDLAPGPGSYTFSFATPVTGVNVPLVFASTNAPGAVQFSLNGSPVTLAPANVAGPTPGSACGGGVAAVVSGGLLTNAGTLGYDANGIVQLAGTINSVAVANVGSIAFNHGLYITAGPQAALVAAKAGTNALSVPVNSAGASLDSLLAVTTQNVNLPVYLSVLVPPSHGTLNGVNQHVIAPAGPTTPSGASYKPAAGYLGSDGFSILITDGINSQIAVFNVTLTHPVMDLDANGTVDALTDGLIMMRYLFGLRGAQMISGAVSPNAARTAAADIEAYIATIIQ